jgi:uncharacterized membrane protein YedE/YeeE
MLRYARMTTTSTLSPYFLSGLTFSLGLLLSGMISPLKVISFLHVLPPYSSFDPSLALIVLGGVLPNAVAYYRLQKEEKPSFRMEKWRVPTGTDLDTRLVLGAAIFGAGWGLSGVCPGPALVGLSQTALAYAMGEGPVEAVKAVAVFVSTMVAGMGAVSVIA